MKVSFNVNDAKCIAAILRGLNEIIAECLSSEASNEMDPERKQQLTAGANYCSDIVSRIKAGEDIEFDFTGFDEDDGLNSIMEALGGLIGCSYIKQAEEEKKQ